MFHQLSREYFLTHRGNNFSLFSLTTLFVANIGAHFLGPGSPIELLHARAIARSEVVGGALDILRATGRDASVTTQASPYGQSAAFAATPLFRDDQSRRRRESRERFRDGVGSRGGIFIRSSQPRVANPRRKRTGTLEIFSFCHPCQRRDDKRPLKFSRRSNHSRLSHMTIVSLLTCLS